MRKSYSQVGQDLFAMERASHTTYLDIGASEAKLHNNTYSLDMRLWSGICVDKNFYVKGSHLSLRSSLSHFVCADAIHVDWLSLLTDYDLPSHLGYLSLDCDDDTLTVLRNMPNEITFDCATIEHDSYRLGSENRDEIRSIMYRNGYKPVRLDVSIDEMPFEDWWIRA